MAWKLSGVGGRRERERESESKSYVNTRRDLLLKILQGTEVQAAQPWDSGPGVTPVTGPEQILGDGLDTHAVTGWWGCY